MKKFFCLLILISIFLSCDSDSTVWDEGSQSTDDYKTDCILLLISFICVEVDFQPLIIKKQLIDNEFLKVRAIEIYKQQMKKNNILLER